MVGDTILTVIKFFKQHIFCLHNYKIVNRKDNGNSFELCNKCEKIK